MPHVMPTTDDEPQIGEHARLAELLQIMGRHGLNGLASRLGLLPGRSEQPVDIGTPERVVALLQDLGPVAVKLGQVLATREDLLGPEWVRALSTLQDRVTPLPFEALEPTILTALGSPIADVFARFDREPIAAASIAQVHGATLRDGTEVVVKVRRPGIAERVDADLRLLRRVARLAARHSPEIRRLKPDELLRFFAESLTQEMDLSAEAAACENIGAFLRPLGICTPAFHWDQVGRRINVQERLDGLPVRAILDAEREGGADVAGKYADAVLRMIIFNGRFHADPHPGNVFVLADGSLAFIDFGAVGVLSPARRNEVVTLVLAIAGEDTRSVTDVLLQWSGETDVDRQALTRDLDALIGQFRGAVLQQIELADIFGRVFALLRTYRLALPPDLALLVRTLLIAEGFVRRLDPGFDIAARAAPIARELLRERIGPAGLKRGGRRLATSLGRLAAASPELVAFAERVARSGALPIELQGGAVFPTPASPWRADPNILSAGLLVAGAILQRDHDVVGAMLMASAVLPAGWAWVSSRQRR
ncbi:ubiquinone biosynthesis protein (plasmid) [Sphingobium cloacae]|uniref:Ubiquinone biosynthesis protein n=2 Tax=Sphingobium cloacae TaxID=120107 RepID=A0A1E1F7U2_9SPHN|nr:ubiquinone biosynthesis protein [Sphingobium cloacae]